jgi:hypothetical protein
MACADLGNGVKASGAGQGGKVQRFMAYGGVGVIEWGPCCAVALEWWLGCGDTLKPCRCDRGTRSRSDG